MSNGPDFPKDSTIAPITTTFGRLVEAGVLDVYWPRTVGQELDVDVDGRFLVGASFGGVRFRSDSAARAAAYYAGYRDAEKDVEVSRA